MFGQVIVRTWGIGELLIFVIVIAACIGIAAIAVKASGINIPAWVIQIFWIVLVVVVAIFAIRFLLSL